MTLGDVLRKERERRKLSVDQVASGIGLSAAEYEKLESGRSEIEEWGPRVGRIAIHLKTPTSRLIGGAGQIGREGQEESPCGHLIKASRKKAGLSEEELAKLLEIQPAEMNLIESGESPVETYGPILLRFARIVDLPVFNLLYPCGLPLDCLSDYP
jgi:transcriptional regulator with XRE-family HTH domain